MDTDDELVINNMKLAYKLSYDLYKKYRLYLNIELEDIQSLCFLGLVKASKTFDKNIASFSTYAYNIMSNEVIKYIKSIYKYKNDISLYKENENGNTLEDVLEDNFDIDEGLNKDVSKSVLYHYLNQLDEKEIKIIEYSLKGLSQQQIAEKLNLTRNTVNKIYNKAINRLRFKFLLEKRLKLDKGEDYI